MLSRLAHGVDSATKSRKRRCRTGVPKRPEGVVLQVGQRSLRGVRSRGRRWSAVAVGEGAARGRLAARAALEAVVRRCSHGGVALDAGLACGRVGAALGDGLALLLQPAPAVCWLRAADVQLRPQSCGRKEQARVSKDSATNLRQQEFEPRESLRHLPRRFSARYLWKAHSTLSEPSDGSGSWVTFHQAPSPQSSQVPAAVLPQPFQPQQDESGSKSCWATIPGRADVNVSSRVSGLPKRVGVGRA